MAYGSFEQVLDTILNPTPPVGFTDTNTDFYLRHDGSPYVKHVAPPLPQEAGPFTRYVADSQMNAFAKHAATLGVPFTYGHLRTHEGRSWREVVFSDPALLAVFTGDPRGPDRMWASYRIVPTSYTGGTIYTMFTTPAGCQGAGFTETVTYAQTSMLEGGRIPFARPFHVTWITLTANEPLPTGGLFLRALGRLELSEFEIAQGLAQRDLNMPLAPIEPNGVNSPTDFTLMTGASFTIDMRFGSTRFEKETIVRCTLYGDA